MLARIALALTALAGCQLDDRFVYRWDDRPVLCSQGIDDLTNGVDVHELEEQLRAAAATRTVALLHAHGPGTTVSVELLTRVLDRARELDLAHLTYSELTSGPPRAGLALGFDDADVRGWTAIAALLDAYGARVTFFVSRYTYWTDEEHDLLRGLAERGHDVQPHGVDHVEATRFAREHGADAYVATQVEPASAVLDAAGYRPTTFAYPFGYSNPALDAAILAQLDRVRVGPGGCPD